MEAPPFFFFIILSQIFCFWQTITVIRKYCERQENAETAGGGKQVDTPLVRGKIGTEYFEGGNGFETNFNISALL
jgi:hypothetical protein